MCMYPRKRKVDTRCEKRLFVVSVEGAVTEVEYLRRLEKLHYGTCIIDILSNVNKSSPCSVLERMRNHRCSLKRGDELWCVVDKDRWNDTQLDMLESWASEMSPDISRHLGLSNPKIELWLLLHFADWSPGMAVSSALATFMPNYDKHLDERRITRDSIKKAIERGATLIPDGKPHRDKPGTNLWVLAKNIADAVHCQLRYSPKL